MEQQSIALPTSTVVAICAGTIFLFGFGWAVMRRANDDYKKTKAALPGLRRDFWRAWWKVVKTGFVVGLVFVGLLLWAVHDIREANPAPAAPPSPTPKITDRWVKPR